MKMIARNVLLLAAFSTLWACSSGNAPVDIGDSRTGEKLEDYAAVWEGYAEAYNFSDGSDKVKLTLDAAGNGTLEIGDSAPLPPLNPDPNVGYPGGYLNLPNLENLVPGFPYPIAPATVELARIRFSADPYEIESDWCALQTSYASAKISAPDGSGPLYRCIPDGSGSGGPDVCIYNGQPMDCEKLEACIGDVCACNAQGCSGSSGEPKSYTKLDAALEVGGSSLVGTMLLGPDGARSSMTVRLKRH
jgi:hypothetical protein